MPRHCRRRCWHVPAISLIFWRNRAQGDGHCYNFRRDGGARQLRPKGATDGMCASIDNLLSGGAGSEGNNKFNDCQFSLSALDVAIMRVAARDADGADDEAYHSAVAVLVEYVVSAGSTWVDLTDRGAISASRRDRAAREHEACHA